MLPKSMPEPEFFRPHAGEPALRWGIIGTGQIARQFALALHAHTTQELIAVGSRSLAKAQEFVTAVGAERAYGSYDELYADPEIDVIYIATPHSEHVTQGLAAIAAGKHVLVEKPLAASVEEARELFDTARRAGLLAMEAMWTRYLPQTQVLRALLDEGVFGEVRTVRAELCQALTVDLDGRLYRPELAGGALLDMGIYPAQFDSLVRGAPIRVVAAGGLTDTGVDAFATVILSHETGEDSVISTSMVTHTTSEAAIFGTDAWLKFTSPFHAPSAFVLGEPRFWGETRTWIDETGMAAFHGLSWEANAFARYVGEGRLESPLHTHAETLSILASVLEARRQVGVLCVLS